MSHSLGSMLGKLTSELNQIYTTSCALLNEGYKAFKEIPTVQKISQTISPVLEKSADYIPKDFKTKGFAYGAGSMVCLRTSLYWVSNTPDKTLNHAISTAEKKGLANRAAHLKGGLGIND